MEFELKPNEHIDDLLLSEYKIIQSKCCFSFSTDAVLLADFIKGKKTDKIIDLGTGGGVIPLLLKAKDKAIKIEALELQEALVDMAKRSVALNGLEDDITITQGDFREIKKYYPPQSFKIVASNPPYFPVARNINVSEAVAIAKHELTMQLEDVIKAANYLLNNRGKFFLVHRPDRLTDILSLLRKYHLEPKRMCLVYPKENAEPNLVLVESSKGAKRGLRIEPPLYIYDEKGDYTEKLQEIYGMR